ncbi:sigma 54-interacting transcriptional regulator [Myxococcota bacterium]|nr:sigma 54-interacting transcriptional regulator [Myxococcota bacterium]
MSTLLVTHGHHFGVRYDLMERTTIGRSSSCSIQLLDEKVSRLHSTLYREDGHVWIRDEGSSNGTGVNGELLLEPRRLQAGDEIAVGNNLLLFDSDITILRDREGAGAVILSRIADATAVTEAGTGASPDGVAFHTEGLIGALARALASPKERRASPWTVLEALVRGIGADRAALLRAPEEGEPLKAVATYPARGRVAVPQDLVERCLSEGKALRMDDAVSDLRIRAGRSVIESRIGSVLCIPVSRGGRVLALLYVDSQVRGAFRSLPVGVVEDLAVLLLPSLMEPSPQPAPAPPDAAEDAPVSQSPAMHRLLKLARRYATSTATLLLTGESGTGKEVIARWIHHLGPRRERPFVAVNCGALPEALAESELFGHEKGAFTGAVLKRVGMFEQADRGTLLLDEVGDLPPPIQVKLLRALQEGRFYRVGGTRPVECDVRVIAATHRDLEEMVREGRFREDLFYRLNVLRLEVPPLRERIADIEPLVQRFVERFNARAGTAFRGFTPEAMGLLEAHPWPGNVREIENFVERVMVLCEEDVVDADAVREQISEAGDGGGSALGDRPLPLAAAVARLERQLVEAALRKAGGKKSHAARILGISRPTLDRKIEEYALEVVRR